MGSRDFRGVRSCDIGRRQYMAAREQAVAGRWPPHVRHGIVPGNSGLNPPLYMERAQGYGIQDTG